MLTIDHISQIHASVKSGSNFPQYVQDLKALGLAYYDVFICDGHSEYHAVSGEQLQTPDKYQYLEIAPKANTQALRQTIRKHQRGQINFLTFCLQAAHAGVHAWRTDITHLRCIFYDRAGHEILIEPIPYARPSLHTVQPTTAMSTSQAPLHSQPLRGRPLAHHSR